MGTRRVKNISYDDYDDYGDYDDYDEYEDYDVPKAKPKPKPKAAAKPKAKAAPKPKVAAKTAAPKAEAKKESKPKEVDSSSSTQNEAQKLLEEAEDDMRENINIVVVGHVDAGKSTLMGHLLLRVGAVSSQTITKYQREAKQMNKGSFAFAWVLDTGDDERERGVTIDVCVKHFSTKRKRVSILDAPGHRDFVPNMLAGAVQADAAILVVDVKNFEAGFQRGGQTKEHIQLVRALGIGQLLVAINKLDRVGWSEDAYQKVVDTLHQFIVGPEANFKSNAVKYVPLSAFEGVNIVDNNCRELKEWWSGATLVEAIDNLEPPRGRAAKANKGLRCCVSDSWQSGGNAHFALKVDSGTLSRNQRVLLLPSREIAQVKTLESRGMIVKAAKPGDFVDNLGLTIDPQLVGAGVVICSPDDPLPVVSSLWAQVVVFDVEVPIVQGQQVMLYLHTAAQGAVVSRLVALVNKKTGEKEARRPKALAKGDLAILQLSVANPMALEYKPVDPKEASGILCRVVLRDQGRTIAAGMALDPTAV